ncbi:MAG: hypothetical protein KAR38_05970, partial [Calditrichia bacterium]|nr:hypothetical protein [Calditrichia bacterium]
MNLRFIDKFYKKSVINKKIQGKFLYYLFTVIISLFFAAFILYYLFKGSDVQNYKAEDSSLRNDKEVQLQSSEKINNKKLYVAGESIELNENIIEEKENLDDLDGKNLDKFSKKESDKKVSILNFKQLTSQKSGKTDIENIKPANNNIFANIEKFEKPIIDDTIKLLPETELSNYEIYREDSAISKELLDGITVALFENQTDNLDSNEITYNYINTSNEAVL